MIIIITTIIIIITTIIIIIIIAEERTLIKTCKERKQKWIGHLPYFGKRKQVTYHLNLSY